MAICCSRIESGNVLPAIRQYRIETRRPFDANTIPQPQGERQTLPPPRGSA